METLNEQNINEVTEKVKEYAEISKSIKITQEKLKILNKKNSSLIIYYNMLQFKLEMINSLF